MASVIALFCASIYYQDRADKLRRRNIEAITPANIRLEKARKQAERANKSKSLFLANMSHELRTLMHAIMSFSRLGLTRIGTEETGKIEKFLSNVHASGARLLNLLNDLLDFSKLEAERVELEMKDHDLVKLVQSCINDGMASVLRFSIEDQGSDIPEDELDDEFDEFTQSSKTMTHAGGTGLGLSICRRIVKAHKGKIWAENVTNNFGTGARFNVEIPA